MTYIAHPEAVPQEITLFRGDNVTINAQFRQQDTNAAFDISTWECWWALKIRAQYNDSQVLIYKSTLHSTQGIKTNEPNGEVEFYLLRSDTSGLKAGVYFWDMGIFRQSSSEKKTCEKGQLTLEIPVVWGDPWSI